jgi:two-component system, NtrC family, sensor kinase
MEKGVHSLLVYPNKIIMRLKPVFLLLVGIGCCINSLQAQLKLADSLQLLISKYRQTKGYEKNTVYITTLNELSFRNTNSNPDTAIILANEVLILAEAVNDCYNKTDAQKNLGLAYNVKGEYTKSLLQLAEALQTGIGCNYQKGVARIYHNTGIVYSNIGNYPEALKNYFTALKTREEIKDTLGISSTINGIGGIYFVQGKYSYALKQYLRSLQLAEAINYASGAETAHANIGEVYYKQGKYAEARTSLNKALAFNKITGSTEIKAFVYYTLSSVFLQEGKLAEAEEASLKTKQFGQEMSSPEYAIRANLGLSEIRVQQKNFPGALAFVKEAEVIAHKIGHNELLRDINELLSIIYEKTGNNTQALFHHKQFKVYADSINNQQTEQRSLNLSADYEYSKKEIVIRNEFERRSTRQKWIIFSAIAALISALIVVFLIFRSRQKEKKSNLLLQRKNTEIDKQKSVLEKTLTDLKAAQQQLIQSEKMASLGELTAGIAHEIQNPLNFVNNFSEVSTELVKEMVEEVEKGNTDEAKTIANDVVQNLEKINHHGRRAADIVKGMLQHSRSSSGQKELTDLNALCDEYLRLSYHGLRATDKSFNAKFETSFDAAVEKTNVVPQDMGRVVLNLISNAFYAVNEKKKTAGPAYEPTVTISTKKTTNGIEIKVTDNGTGIPQKAINKIFQPFFTTKPTGQGTGLGLSLSYDIVKAHGGELKVETKEGEGSAFVILLSL